MRKKPTFKPFLKSIYHYTVFFLLIAFVITCCMMLFLSIMSDTLGVELTDENLSKAANITFGNVVLLSFLYTIIDTLRRKLMVERPVKKIVEAAEKITKGDFSVRIEPVRGIDNEVGFNKIIECFNKMAEELSGIETLRTDFIANVSHELKTPLAVIGNYGTMLQETGLSEEKRKEYAKTVTESSHSLADLITNILKLNKLENQQIFPQRKKYNLGEQLCECLLNFENEWEKEKINIETEIEEDVFIEEDPELMSIVWNNLFSNAIKFTPMGGTVSLNVRSCGEFIFVDVKDTGCGISNNVGVKIFDKFYQGDTSRATKGNGLGLALVKRVVDITGSEISVVSEIEKGSTFTVKLRRIDNESN